MEFNDFITLDYMCTYMGTVVVTMLIVQFTKELPGVKKIPTRYYTFLVAFFNILICNILNETFTIAKVYLMLINAMLVTFTATGGYDFSIKKVIIDEPEKIETTDINNDMK
ncbi:hypothetical protein [Clostridium lundense]|uniref:hypothetical protein n=1 Tax=Clostridium lundense TaxID=319475 RepID=UPI000487B1D5|nr:hypothetical protein [Clostridium lundense]